MKNQRLLKKVTVVDTPAGMSGRTGNKLLGDEKRFKNKVFRSW